MLSELDEVVKVIFRKYKPALSYIGVDFGREDVQQALLEGYDGIEGAFQAVIEYWYLLQRQQRLLEYPSACLITAITEQWQPLNWQEEYLDNPKFKTACELWWEKAAQVWGEQARNQLVADVTERDDGYEYILFRCGKTLPLTTAQVWGWERVLEFSGQ